MNRSLLRTTVALALSILAVPAGARQTLESMGVPPIETIDDPYVQEGPLESCMAKSQAMPKLCEGLPSGKNGFKDNYWIGES